MKVVLSIKPEFASKIFDGTKTFEFRKSIFKDERVNSIIVYASSPVQKVIGEFEIEKILKHDLETLWELTKEESGITKEYFYKYFSDKKDGFAIKVTNLIKYDQPLCLKEDFDLSPPQSFAYVR